MAILQPELPGARVLDLFAGTGTVGLRALELGAREVVFVEGNSSVARTLRPKLAAGCHLVTARLPMWLERLEGPFDVVLADPPYNDPAGLATLERLGSWSLKVAVFEHHHKEGYPEQVGGLQLTRQRRFGETALSFYRPFHAAST